MHSILLTEEHVTERKRVELRRLFLRASYACEETAERDWKRLRILPARQAWGRALYRRQLRHWRSQNDIRPP